MSAVQGWFCTIVLLAVMLAIPTWVYRAVLFMLLFPPLIAIIIWIF